jgi:predicted metal-dependent RNase
MKFQECASPNTFLTAITFLTILVNMTVGLKRTYWPMKVERWPLIKKHFVKHIHRILVASFKLTMAKAPDSIWEKYATEYFSDSDHLPNYIGQCDRWVKRTYWPMKVVRWPLIKKHLVTQIHRILIALFKLTMSVHFEESSFELGLVLN